MGRMDDSKSHNIKRLSLLMLVMSVADPKTIATVTLVGLNHHHLCPILWFKTKYVKILKRSAHKTQLCSHRANNNTVGSSSCVSCVQHDTTTKQRNGELKTEHFF